MIAAKQGRFIVAILEERGASENKHGLGSKVLPWTVMFAGITLDVDLIDVCESFGESGSRFCLTSVGTGRTDG